MASIFFPLSSGRYGANIFNLVDARHHTCASGLADPSLQGDLPFRKTQVLP
jgi:hypothetical protein